MMTNLLSFVLFILFFMLGGLHFYWLMGGKWALKNSLPTNENGELMLYPKPIATAIVGLVLLSFSIFYFIQSQIIDFAILNWVFKYSRMVYSFYFYS